MESRFIIKAENVLLENVDNYDFSTEGYLNVTYNDGTEETLFTYTRGSRYINCCRLINCNKHDVITVLEKMYYYHSDLKGYFNV